MFGERVCVKKILRDWLAQSAKNVKQKSPDIQELACNNKQNCFFGQLDSVSCTTMKPFVR